MEGLNTENVYRILKVYRFSGGSRNSLFDFFGKLNAYRLTAACNLPVFWSELAEVGWGVILAVIRLRL
jgi:hypothetical protein